MYTFPELIKKIRNESGLTQEQFAKVLSVSPILVSMIEVGQKEVSKNFIKKLADMLEVHPSSITPFLFIDSEFNKNDVSNIERGLIDFGEKIQEHLINQKAQKLRRYV